LPIQLVTHLRKPLYRNGYALILSAVSTSGFGLIYWVMAARYYQVEVVGINSALLSAMQFLAGISLLSLNSVLIRFIPLAGRKTSRLILAIYLICAGAAAVSSLVFVSGVRFWSHELEFLDAQPLWLPTFMLATIAWSIFQLQDNAMTGLRQAGYVPVENILFAVTKLALLLVFANRLQQSGIFISWIIPVFITIPLVNLLIFRRLIPRHVQQIQVEGDREVPIIPREIARYAAANYLGALFHLASTTLLPVLVTSYAGASANAYFYLPWMITTSLQLVALNMTTSLTVEAMVDQENLRKHAYRILINILRLLAPIVVVILFGAPYFLQIFGKNYAVEGTALLRLLALSTVPNVVVALSLGLARVQNRAGLIIFIQGTVCLLGFGLSYIFLRNFGIAGIGLAWLISQFTVALFLIWSLRAFFAKQSREINHP
jgi:O-antigen/teichoic acid export membrane protein